MCQKAKIKPWQKMKSREEIRFLALLSKSQEKASKLKNGHKAQKSTAELADSNAAENEEDEWRLPKVSLKSDILNLNVQISRFSPLSSLLKL